MITSSVVRFDPRGWRPRIIHGSTSPAVYPLMSSWKLPAIWKSSSTPRWKPGKFLATNLTAWSSCLSPSTGVSSQERFGHVRLISWGFCAFSGAFSRSLGAILLAQLAGNHAKRAEAPLVRSTNPVVRRCGRSVTRTLTGPLGARLRFTSELLRAEPMSSDRMGRNQKVAYNRHSVSGVTMDSANLINELIAFCQSNCESPGCLQDILHPGTLPAQPQFTGHTQQDPRKLFLDGNQRQGQSRLSGMQNGFPSGWILSINIASLSAALQISSSEGSSAASGMGGHHEMVGSSGSLSPSVEAASSSEERSLTVSLAPSGLASFIVPGSNWRSSVAKSSTQCVCPRTWQVHWYAAGDTASPFIIVRFLMRHMPGSNQPRSLQQLWATVGFVCECQLRHHRSGPWLR